MAQLLKRMKCSWLFLGLPLAWISGISVLHGYLNLGWGEGEGRDKEGVVRIGFLPVTCHLTCPVTDFIRRESEGGALFEPLKFNSWPELKEAFLAGETKASFLLAPMAIALREQGVPLKIVYLGHRDGTAVMVHKESSIRSFADLRGKTVAVPNRFSNQRLLIFRAMRDAGVSMDEINMVEMPPPDMPAALSVKAVDAICSGEPFMGQTELDGYGRVLALTKDMWPGFISCVLVVHEDMIRDERPFVQELVNGIASSGLWMDRGPEERDQAARLTAKHYYNQHPRLLQFVLSKPPDRVTYSSLDLMRENFEEIEEIGAVAGIFEGDVEFDDYADSSFNPVKTQLARVEFDYDDAERP